MKSLLVILLLVAICGACDSQCPAKRAKRDLIGKIAGDAMSVIETVVPYLFNMGMFLLKQVKSLLDTWGLAKSTMAMPVSENDEDEILMRKASKVLSYVFAVEARAVYCAINHHRDIEKAVTDVISKFVSCIQGHATESELTFSLYNIARKSVDLAVDTYEKIINCTTHGNILTIGVCLGGVAFNIESKGLGLLKDALNLVSKGVNLINFLTSVPVSAVICAGSQFINIGTETARIAVDVVGCLISNDYSQAPLIDGPLAVPVIVS